MIYRTKHINKKTRSVVSCGYNALEIAKSFGLIETGDIIKDIAKSWELIEQNNEYKTIERIQ